MRESELRWQLRREFIEAVTKSANDEELSWRFKEAIKGLSDKTSDSLFWKVLAEFCVAEHQRAELRVAARVIRDNKVTIAAVERAVTKARKKGESVPEKPIYAFIDRIVAQLPPKRGMRVRLWNALQRCLEGRYRSLGRIPKTKTVLDIITEIEPDDLKRYDNVGKLTIDGWRTIREKHGVG